MEHVQSMRLLDLTADEPDDASPRLKQRRALLRTAGLAAFAPPAAAPPSRRRWIATTPARRRCVTPSPT